MQAHKNWAHDIEFKIFVCMRLQEYGDLQVCEELEMIKPPMIPLKQACIGEREREREGVLKLLCKQNHTFLTIF